jgi:MSHA biogenesis protein MshN
LSLINQVLQNVEARQGGATLDASAGNAWAAQVKPVLSHSGSVATAWIGKLVWGLLLLALIGALLVNWPMLVARFYPKPVAGQPVPSTVAIPVVPAAGTEISVAEAAAPATADSPAWSHPQFTKALFSAWQAPVKNIAQPSLKLAVTKPASAKTIPPQVEGEFTINPAEGAAANPVVAAIEPGNAVKLTKNSEEESGPRGVVNKQIRPEQEVNLLIQRAVDQEQKGRLNEALIILRQALTTYPQSEDARQLLATYLFESRQEPEAVAVLQAGIKQFPGQIGLSKSLAKWQLSHAQPEAVLQTLKPVANLLIQDAESQWMLAMAYQQTGQHAAALPHFDRANVLRPGHAQWIVAYAISLQAAGQPAQALQQLQQAYNLPLSDRLSEFVGQRIRQLGGVAVVRSE